MNGCGERAGAIAADRRCRIAPIQCLFPDRRASQLDVGRRMDSSAREASPVRTSRERSQAANCQAGRIDRAWALGTGLEGPRDWRPKSRLSRSHPPPRPDVRHLNPRKSPQIAGYSSETWKRRFVSECVVGPGDLPRSNDFNALRCLTALSGHSDAKGLSSALSNSTAGASGRKCLKPRPRAEDLPVRRRFFRRRWSASTRQPDQATQVRCSKFAAYSISLSPRG